MKTIIDVLEVLGCLGLGFTIIIIVMLLNLDDE